MAELISRTHQLLMEVIDTGPVTHRDLRRFGTPLINEQLEGARIYVGDVYGLIDDLNSIGYVGLTGAKLDTVVLSSAGREILTAA